MLVEEILKSTNNTVVEGTYLLNDPKLKPFNEKEGHFFTFNLQDKTGISWAKIWDDAEHIAQQIKEQNIQVVTIKGRTNLYNGKLQVIVEKIKKADSYDMKDLIKMATSDPEAMWNELVALMKFSNVNFMMIFRHYETSPEFLTKFKLWPGGKGAVHHAYQHGLLEHTLSIVKLVKELQERLSLVLDIEKAILGAFVHDIGKIDAYDFDIRTTMTNIGRLQEHTVLGYYRFRRDLETLVDINDRDRQFIAEEIGHIILSHHSSMEHHSVIKPMTLEAKLVAFADFIDAETNHMSQQLLYNTDEQGWVFDNLHEQFYFRRPQMKRRKMS